MEINNEHRLTEVEARSKSNTRRIDDFEHRLVALEQQTTTVAVLAERMKGVESNVEEIKVDVKSLKAKPAKHWENLISQGITIVVAAVLGFFLAKLGL